LRLELSALALLLAAVVPARRWRDHAYLIYAVGLISLLAVLVLGRATNHARSWLDLGGGFKLQPSEFMKIGLLLALAKWFAEHPRPRRFEDLVVPAALSACPVALVLAQPDLGTALTFGPLFLALCWLAGTPWKRLRWILLIPMTLAPLALFAVQDYQRERVEIWWRQDHLSQEDLRGPGYQLWQSKIAVGSGGLTGFGWARGPENRLGMLPERHNDFIFPVLAEEEGFLGAAAFLLLYGGLGCYLLVAAGRHRAPFTRFVIAGAGVHFLVHLCLNVGVTLGLIPTTGLALPLISFGGSSIDRKSTVCSSHLKLSRMPSSA